LLHRYSEQHPDVVSKRREIRRYLESATPEPAAQVPQEDVEQIEDEDKPALSVFDFPIRAAYRELERLQQDEAQIRDEIAKYTSRIEAADTVEAKLTELSRDVEVVRGQYNDYLLKIEAARAAERLEESEAGSTFEVASYASIPEVPVTPKPVPLLGIGVVSGLFVFVAPLVVKHVLSPVVVTAEGVRLLCEVPVLVAIPSIPGPLTDRRARSRRRKNLGLSLLSILVFAAVLAAVSYTSGLVGV
jgi:uncharacterized protein involved in exopolysaccharide biosynthesis